MDPIILFKQKNLKILFTNTFTDHIEMPVIGVVCLFWDGVNIILIIYNLIEKST